MDSADAQPHGTNRELVFDRRTALRATAIGGAALWTTPVITALTVRTADAASGPGPEPTLPPPTPPEVVDARPSHGFFLLRSNSALYGYQIIGPGTSLTVGSVMSPEYVGSPGQGNDVPYWQSIGFSPIITASKGTDKTWSVIRSGISAGQTTFDSKLVLVLSGIPTGASLVNAFIWDGSFQKDADGDMVRPAVLSDGKYYFFK